jgi:hypothetical protein
MTITLPLELELVVTEQAHRQGTTPELLALERPLSFLMGLLFAADSQ